MITVESPNRLWSNFLVGATLGLCLGAASAQTISNIQVITTYQRPGTQGSSAGIWGWTGSDGKEYALLTSRNPGGVMAVEIFDGTNPVVPPKLRGWIPAGHNSIWQEVSAAGNYAYKVSQEGSHGIQIINLAPLNSGGDAVKVKDFSASGISVNHTVYCDTTITPWRMYVTRGSAAGVRIFSLADPVNPVQIGDIPGEAHDMYARGNRLYISTQRRGTVEIWNVANAASPVRQGVIQLGSTIAHNSWPTDNNSHLFTSEEITGKPVKVFNLSTVASPPKVSEYRGVGTGSVIAHNVFVKGNYLYIGFYTAGLRIWDISDPANMKEVAYHRPSTATGQYDGSWGVYPWFKSGLVIHGDDRAGLFVVRPNINSVHAGANIISPRFGIDGLRDGAIDFRLPQAGNYVLSIYTPAGREIFNQRAQGAPGMQSLSLGNGKLSEGNYVVQLRQDAHVLSAPVSLRN